MDSMNSMRSEGGCSGRSRRDRGFSLNELLVAMGILAVPLLAVAAMLPVAATNVDYSGGTSQATALAQRRLEQVGNLPFPTLAGMVTTANPPGAPVSSEETITGAHNTPFTVRTWVQLVAGTTAPRREASATVIVSWTEPSLGGTKSLRLDTLVAE